MMLIWKSNLFRKRHIQLATMQKDDGIVGDGAL